MSAMRFYQSTGVGLPRGEHVEITPTSVDYADALFLNNC